MRDPKDEKPRSKGKKRANTGGYGQDWKGFVDITLSDKDRELMAGWAASGEWEPFEALDALLGGGYKVSLAVHPASGSVIATLTCRAEDDPNFGYALSAFGPDPEGALMCVSYKHFVMCESGAWLNSPAGGLKQKPMFG